MKSKRTRFWGNLAFYGLATAIALTFIIPLLWMISSSLRTPGLPPPRTVEWLPAPFAWRNYALIFRMLPLGRYLFNSLFVSSLAVLITLLIASWAGFGMSQLGRRARRWLLILSIALLMVPVTAVWLTRFILFTWLGWIDSYLALLAPTLMGSSSFFVLLFYWAFRRLTVEQIEAARLEGANPLVIWARIALPQVRPTLVAVAVLTFILYWNDFINPLLYLKSQRLYTLAVGLQQLQQLDRSNLPLQLAAAVVMTLPVLLLFWLVQVNFLHEQSWKG